MWWFRNGTERRFLRLLNRYLDPGRSWSVALDRRLRGDMAESDGLRTLYDRAITAHRLMLGLPVDTASALENERMSHVIVGSLGGVVSPSPIMSNRWLAACGAMGAAAAVALVVAPSGDSDLPLVASDDRYVGVRSGASPAETATRIGLVGVTEDGVEYEVEANGVVYVDDYARLNYRSSVSDLDHLFLFGLQPDADPLWYYPLPEEQQSMAIASGPGAVGQDVPDETLLSKRHAVGRWYVVGVFSDEPISWEHVQRRLGATAGADFGVDDVAATDAVAERVRDGLGLTARHHIEVVAVEIKPGSYESRR